MPDAFTRRRAARFLATTFLRRHGKRRYNVGHLRRQAC